MRCSALSFVKAAQVLHGSGECGQGRQALGLRASAPPSAFINPATSRLSCSRNALCCDVIPALRMLSPIVFSQSLSDTRRRRHIRALARSLPDDALAFLAHTSLQPPMSCDGSAGCSADATLDCDLDIDDVGDESAAGPSVKEFETGVQYKGVIEKNIYGYGDHFTVRVTKVTLEGRSHFSASFSSLEEARAARDAALSGAHAAAYELQNVRDEASANVFTDDGLKGGDDAAAATSAVETRSSSTDE
jgi:hypothetical protein